MMTAATEVTTTSVAATLSSTGRLEPEPAGARLSELFARHDSGPGDSGSGDSGSGSDTSSSGHGGGDDRDGGHDGGD
jgi:hypothetical protein